MTTTVCSSSPDVVRLRRFFASGRLVHPYLPTGHFSDYYYRGGGEDAEAETETGVRPRGTTQNGDGTSPSFTDSSDAVTTVVANFADLSSALALCCGVRVGAAAAAMTDPAADTETSGGQNAATAAAAAAVERMASEIGGVDRRHVIFVLCDGMGTNVIRRHLMKPPGSSPDVSSGEGEGDAPPFLVRNNRTHCHSGHPPHFSLRAVFPSTTPAALTTLATASWPGRHGVPGWDLRDVARCEFPGSGGGRRGEGASSGGGGGGGPVQIRILADRVTDYRSGRPLREAAPEFYETNEVEGRSRDVDRIFVEEPWVRRIGVGATGDDERGQMRRRMLFVNAYNGDEFPSWYQSHRSNKDDDVRTEVGREAEGRETATEFSAWQQHRRPEDGTPAGRERLGHENDNFQDVGSGGDRSRYGLLETFKIPETSFDTLGEPEGSAAAVEYFERGVDATLRFLADAERRGHSTYTYVYTAHPDKHMHALGVEHDEVGRVVRGIDRELERLWSVLGDRRLLLSKYCDDESSDGPSGENGDRDVVVDGMARVDAALVVTADHGHVTVEPEEMVELTDDILECLEYANIGVHGKGRHAYLHCRSGYRTTLPDRWRTADGGTISANFLLLTIDEAVGEGLFGPVPPRMEVRPRLGDFVAIATGRSTLVTPREAKRYRRGRSTRCGSSFDDDGDDGTLPTAHGRRQGAHGSLLPDEMEIPFVLCTP